MELGYYARYAKISNYHMCITHHAFPKAHLGTI
jgi:hypothetical protein